MEQRLRIIIKNKIFYYVGGDEPWRIKLIDESISASAYYVDFDGLRLKFRAQHQRKFGG